MLAYSINSFKEGNKMNGKNVLIQNNGTITYIPTCEKSTYEPNKIKLARGAEVLLNSYNQNLSLNNAFSAREINLENIMLTKKLHLEETIMFKESPLYFSGASDYLKSIETHMSDDLVTTQNYKDINKLANIFTGQLTSFCGLESRMSSDSVGLDYMFAVSSTRGEREKLVKLLDNGGFPEELIKKSEWQNVARFVKAWADSETIVNKNILSVWFEFDTAENEMGDFTIPSLFLHTKPLRIDSYEDISKCQSITRNIIPILAGKPVPKKVEECFIKCLKNLPEGALLLDVGIMLSRSEPDMMRLVLNRIQPDQIIPYLKTIGWSDKNNGLSELLEELKRYVSRIVLQINIGEQVDQKIGIECRFFPDLYNNETRWIDFLNFLTIKGLCSPEKRSAFLQFSGSTYGGTMKEFDTESYVPSVKLPDDIRPNVLVRYISHVKINYKPNNPLEAKGYLGVKLFEQKE